MPKEVVNTAKAPEAVGPYSQAASGGGFLFCSGQIPLDPSSQELVTATVAEETSQCLQNLKAVLEAGGCDLPDVVKVTAYLTDMDDFPEFNRAYEAFFGLDSPPARATVGVVALPKGARVEVDCVAVLSDDS